MRSRPIALLVGALVFAGCGGNEPQPPATTEVAEDSARGTGSPAARGERPGKKNDQDATSALGESGADRAGGGGQPAGAAGEDGAEDDGSSRWYPDRGIYIYSQSGTEEFCDASGCMRQDLPPTQEVRATYEAVSGSEVVVVTAAEASDNRFVRTTTRHTPEGAYVTHVRLEFDYQGANFENDYEPDPPVEVTRLPLRAEMTWGGRWAARTSGTYEIEVGAREEVNVGGRVVQAWPLRVDMRFRGDLEGTSAVTVWVDPATAAVVRSAGRIDISSFFGDYRTRFEATLRDGPGYN